MFKWYQEATACYVYLGEYDARNEKAAFEKDIWFNRGWTLQELIASMDLLFFDKNWKPMGRLLTSRGSNDASLLDRVHLRTGVTREVLMASSPGSKRKALSKVSVAQRISWCKGRRTSKPEDSAYCLMGIFSVNMPVLYGEGDKRAFRRLQEEVMRYADDHSIFVWKLPPSLPSTSKLGLLAPSPDCFDNDYSKEARPGHDAHNTNPFQMTNRGLAIHVRMFGIPGVRWIVTPNCSVMDIKHMTPSGQVLKNERKWIGFYLEVNDDGRDCYWRIDSHQLCFVEDRPNSRGQVQEIYVRQPL